MLKKYKLGFDIWGLILFLIIMIPNFIWFAVPAPNDILRSTSITEEIDTIASIFQVVMIICLCVLINKNRTRLCITPWIITVIICCVLYFISWIFYYTGITNPLVIIAMIIPPCMAFLFFAIDRKNKIAIIPITIFSVCHLIYGVANYIIH